MPRKWGGGLVGVIAVIYNGQKSGDLELVEPGQVILAAKSNPDKWCVRDLLPARDDFTKRDSGTNIDSREVIQNQISTMQIDQDMMARTKDIKSTRF